MQKLQAFEAADQKRREAWKDMLSVMADNVDVVLQELFDAHPQLLKVRWEQYTPYDTYDKGYFFVDDVQLYVDDPTSMLLDSEGIRRVSVHEDWIYWNRYVPTSSELIKHAYKAFDIFPPDVLKEKWSDHVQVEVVRREGNRIVAYASILEDHE